VVEFDVGTTKEGAYAGKAEKHESNKIDATS
jgi:hypothetical protein